MTTTQTYIGTLTVIDCGVCGVTFGLEQTYQARVQRNGKWFYCPNGDHIHYFETDEQRMRKERDEMARQRDAARSLAQREFDRRRSAEHQARAYKGVATRVKRRVGRGVCPCCNRTFADLARHMAGQHPEYADTD